jgi:hypothetical protein
LTELLVQCRERNARLGLTGLLLYKDGNFMQVLEGERSVVLAMKQTIATDPRHRGFLVLLEQEIPERDFQTWTMGFRDLSGASEDLPGYSEFLNTPLDAKEFSGKPARVRRLLGVFKKTM